MKNSDPSAVEAIIARLQEEIRCHRQGPARSSTTSGSVLLSKVREHQRVNSHLPIGWPVMPRGLIPKLVAYAKKITRRLLRWYINPLVDQQNAYNAAVTDALATLVDAFRAQEDRLASQSEALAARLEHGQGEVLLRLQRLENWRRDGAPPLVVQPPALQATPVPGGQTIDLFVLAARYRNEEQMRARLTDYDDLFVALLETHQGGGDLAGPVLDIGCGRGELVGHLAELGLSAYGIDIDSDAIRLGQNAGRDVREADVFAHLGGLSDNSLLAITLIQVIEHFEIDDLLRLFKLATRKLAPGGLIVAETVNPLCLWALSNWYLLDPSHRTPLHPETTRFLAEQSGLEQVQMRFLHPVSERGRLGLLPGAVEMPAMRPLVERINRNVEQLNRFLYGPQDYAVIAHKPEV